MNETTEGFMMLSAAVLLLETVAFWDACLVIFGTAFIKMDRDAIMIFWTATLMIIHVGAFFFPTL